MASIVYIPGFNSTSDSAKASLIETWCCVNHINFVPVDYPIVDGKVVYNRTDVLLHINKVVQGIPPDDPIIFFGTSLGGYYAAICANLYGEFAACLNPSVNPYTTLRRHVQFGRISDDDVDSYIGSSLDDVKMHTHNGIVSCICLDDVLDPIETKRVMRTFSKVVEFESDGNVGLEVVDACLDEIQLLYDNIVCRETH